MSFRDLVEGDCAGPSSLIRLTSHFTQDHGFQEEGIQRQRAFQEQPSGSLAGQLVDEFLEETADAPLQTFKMDNILLEMRKLDFSPRQQLEGHEPKLEEFNGNDTAWASQYIASGGHFDEKQHTDAIWDPPPATVERSKPEVTHELGLNPVWADEYLEHSVNLEEKAVGRIPQPGQEFIDASREEMLNGFHRENSRLMQFMHQQRDDTARVEASRSAFPPLDGKWIEEYTNCEFPEAEEVAIGETKVQGVASGEKETSERAEAWAQEFREENAAAMDPDRYESLFWARLEGEWNKISTMNNLVDSHPWLPEYEKYYDPFNEYRFAEENPMREAKNALEEGKRRLEAGDLPSAVLCFEAAVQQDNDNAEAWLMLGKTQAENEQDPLAISALKSCLNLDPTNLVALMTLAVAYTNESYQNQACLTLKEWLAKHDKYKHLVEPASPAAQQHSKSSVSTILFNDVHEEVKELYIKAARMNPREGVDPDIQSGLGVLFNLSCEYDKAADCFRTALSVQSEDCRLWNRYGATLANGQRSEEAVEAYHRALELAPGFIRARYNLGIACINLGAHKEAAEHLLTALNQQSAGRGVEGEKAAPGAMSNAIWSTLRLVLSLMHKNHLNEAVEARDLKALNREFEID